MLPVTARHRIARSLCLLVAALAALALGAAPPALAARGQETMIEDGELLLRSGPQTRAAALDEMRALGARIVKVRVQWREMAPSPAAATKPAFDATDPAAYRAESWAPLDDVVTQATARDLRVLLMLSPPAPEWATRPGERAGHVGVFKTSPSEYGRFVEAVGRRYGGRYGGLPAVTMWSVWNEPNHPQFIQPLSERLGGKTAPSAPHQYRRLYVAAQAALARTGHAADTVLFGEILPVGQGKLSATSTLRPILFLREFFCVDERYRPFRGGAARVRGCSRFPRIVTSGFAYHAYTKPGGPRVVIPHPDDATIAQIGRVERALDAIARTGRVRRRLAIYNTEFGLQTDPPDCAGFGTSLRNQAAYLNEAEFMSFRRPRVKTYNNYLLVDDPIRKQFPPGTNQRYGGFQTGLRFGPGAVRCESPNIRFAAGSAKQPGYDAFRTPLYVRKTRGGVQVFGLARPRRGAPQSIQILRDGRRVKTVTSSGYFMTGVRGRPGKRWQLRWIFDGRTYSSRVARALPDPPADRRRGRAPQRER